MFCWFDPSTIRSQRKKNYEKNAVEWRVKKSIVTIFFNKFKSRFVPTIVWFFVLFMHIQHKLNQTANGSKFILFSVWQNTKRNLILFMINSNNKNKDDEEYAVEKCSESSWTRHFEPVLNTYQNSILNEIHGALYWDDHFSKHLYVLQFSRRKLTWRNRFEIEKEIQKIEIGNIDWNFLNNEQKKPAQKY